MPLIVRVGFMLKVVVLDSNKSPSICYSLKSSGFREKTATTPRKQLDPVLVQPVNSGCVGLYAFERTVCQ